MIKVESDMLVLDSSFSKQDVLAINEFVEIAKKQERDRIVKLIDPEPGLGNAIDDIYEGVLFSKWGRTYFRKQLIALIKGENK